jgi:hypothetical protein
MLEWISHSRRIYIVIIRARAAASRGWLVRRFLGRLMVVAVHVASRLIANLRATSNYAGSFLDPLLPASSFSMNRIPQRTDQNANCHKCPASSHTRTFISDLYIIEPGRIVRISAGNLSNINSTKLAAAASFGTSLSALGADCKQNNGGDY